MNAEELKSYIDEKTPCPMCDYTEQSFLGLSLFLLEEIDLNKSTSWSVVFNIPLRCNRCHTTHLLQSKIPLLKKSVME